MDQKKGTLNKFMAGRTNEEYRSDNRQIILEKQQHRHDNLQDVREKEKAYRDNNRDKVREWGRKKYQRHREKILQQIKERCMCECGIEVNKKHIARHKKTDKHKRLMEQLCNNEPN